MCANKWLTLNCSWCIAVFKTVWLQIYDWEWTEWFILDRNTWNHLAAKKNKFKLVEKYYFRMFTNHMYSLTSRMYNNVLADCWCWVELLVLCSSDAWIYLFVCWQVDSGSFGILSTKYSFVNFRFNMAINKVLHWVACHKTHQTKPI